MSFHETQGVLTSTKHPGGNLMHKHETLITSSLRKTTKFVVVGEDALLQSMKSAE